MDNLNELIRRPKLRPYSLSENDIQIIQKIIALSRTLDRGQFLSTLAGVSMSFAECINPNAPEFENFIKAINIMQDGLTASLTFPGYWEAIEDNFSNNGSIFS